LHKVVHSRNLAERRTGEHRNRRIVVVPSREGARPSSVAAAVAWAPGFSRQARTICTDAG
jgi:hypothetical protein